MTPGEVQGLQALAMRHGGSLSINPDTGLPEAGFLKRVLPSVIGGVVGVATMNPMLGAAVGGGLGTAMSGGNLRQGIMSGIGAYGIGGLGAGFATAGAETLGAAAAPAAELAGTEALMATGFTPTTASLAPAQVSELVSKGVLDQTAANAYGGAYSSAFPTSTTASIQEGFKQAAANPGAFFKQNMFPIGATTLGLLSASAEDRKLNPQAVDQGQIRPYTYAQTRNPDFGNVPGASYFNQSYAEGTPYSAKDGGIVALANGGPVERMSMANTAMNPQGGLYPQGMIDKTQYATPIQRPVSSEMVSEMPAYDRSDPLLMADGGATKPLPVDVVPLAPATNRYTMPQNVPSQAVQDYNQMIATRAANEYITQPSPLSLLPGGGERATAQDTSKIINQYYLKNLGRQADQPGLDYWTQQKMDTGMSLADIQKQIQATPEGQLNKLYTETLGRKPDIEGLRYWNQQLQSGVPIADIRKQFEALPEYLAKQKAATPKQEQTGYSYNPITKTFTEPTAPATPSLGVPNDEGLIAELIRRIDQQRNQGGSGGGKAGGLMPKALKYAAGGISNLGDYSDGGRLLKGPGDGVSDSIPAQIGARQPARLADGEFVVPARIVSELGNGSTDAGARKLYAMMDRVQKKRRKSIGKDKVAVDSKAESVLPA
jgi:hypothetical protein